MFAFVHLTHLYFVSFFNANVGVHIDWGDDLFDVGKDQYHRSNDGGSYAQILVLLGIKRYK